MKGILIAAGEAPAAVDISEADRLGHLQRLVGGDIEAFDALFGEDVCLYVNMEGLYGCEPNRALFATARMEREGFISMASPGRGAVREGDFYGVLFGDIVAVGFDPETGEDRDLTPGEADKVASYFTEVSPPGSGPEAVALLRGGLDVPPHMGAWRECGTRSGAGLGFHRSAGSRTEYMIATPLDGAAGAWSLLHGTYDLADEQSDDFIPEAALREALAEHGASPDSPAAVTLAVAEAQEAGRFEVARTVRSDDDLFIRLLIEDVPEADARRAVLGARERATRVMTSAGLIAAAAAAPAPAPRPPSGPRP